MNPSIQCIFERTFAGLLLIVMGIGMIVGSIYATCRIHSKYRMRFPKKEAKEVGPVGRKIEAFFRAASMTVVFAYFGALGLWGCYLLGENLLSKLGICHLK